MKMGVLIWSFAALLVSLFPLSSGVLADPAPLVLAERSDDDRGAGERDRGTPIELELNRALQKSLDKRGRRPVRLGYDGGKTTRVSVTHVLTAPFDSSVDGAREKALKDLRLSLYQAIGNECELLASAFNRYCDLSSLSVRPVNNNRVPFQEVHLTATATYILRDDINR